MGVSLDGLLFASSNSASSKTRSSKTSKTSWCIPNYRRRRTQWCGCWFLTTHLMYKATVQAGKRRAAWYADWQLDKPESTQPQTEQSVVEVSGNSSGMRRQGCAHRDAHTGMRTQFGALWLCSPWAAWPLWHLNCAPSRSYRTILAAAAQSY